MKIGEGNLLEAHSSADRRQWDRVGRLLHLGLDIQDLEETRSPDATA